MRVLLRLTILILALLGTAIGGSRALGVSQQSIPFGHIFSAPDGTICPDFCMFGIQPGVTTFAHALQLLALHPLTRDLHRLDMRDSTWYSGDDVRLSVARGLDARVQMIKLERLTAPNEYFASSTPLAIASRADVMAVLGTPAAIQMWRVQLSYRAYDAAITYTLYPAIHAEIIHWRRSTRRITMSDSFMQIVMVAQPVSRRALMLDWRGFSAIRLYADKPMGGR